MTDLDEAALEKAAEAVFQVEHPTVNTAVAPDWPDLHPVYKGVWLTYANAAVRAYLDNATIVMGGGEP